MSTFAARSRHTLRSEDSEEGSGLSAFPGRSNLTQTLNQKQTSNSNSLLASSSSAPLVIPPLNSNFAKTLNELREGVERSGDPRLQFAFVKYLFDAAEQLVIDANTLGITFDALGGAMSADEAIGRLRAMFIDEAMKLLKRLALVAPGMGRQPLPEAQFMLAEFYGKGTYGLPVSHHKAFILYVQASKQGHHEAAFRVAVSYEIGAGTKKDVLRAAQFYRKAAAMGNSLAMHKMAKICMYGNTHANASTNSIHAQPHNPPRLKEGFQWLKRAATLASEKHPEALFELALCYEESGSNHGAGNGLDMSAIVLADNRYALQLFREAADFGYPPAMHKVALALEHGRGTDTNIPEAIRYYTASAERGMPDAQLSLARWYLRGCPEAHLNQSHGEAYRWALKAAEAGHPKAMFFLGKLLEEEEQEYNNGEPLDTTGLVGKHNRAEEAREWYTKAAASGYKRAQDKLEAMGKLRGKSQRRCCSIQ